MRAQPFVRIGLLTALLLPAAVSAAETIEVTAEEFAFKPKRIEVTKGETVRIKLQNEGALSHNFTVKELGVSTDTIQTDATGTAEFTPDSAGAYQIICTVPGHKKAGMTATLVVN